MEYEIIDTVAQSADRKGTSVLLIYTGGTLGMVYNDAGTLVPFNFQHLEDYIPSLKKLDLRITVASFEQLIDSSNMNPQYWDDLGVIIKDNYKKYDGFVILHGTDTMAYTASALSFMLGGLNRPVILTGSQLPLGVMRSDARENLFTAIEIAAARDDGQPIVSEVCIYFNSLLLRGNRAKKIRSSQFGAFESENYPHLARAGIIIEYNRPAIKEYDASSMLEYHNQFDDNVVILNLFPNIHQRVVDGVLGISGLKGLILATFGSGNASTDPWFLKSLKAGIDGGLVVLNVSQCIGGRVIQGRYETSQKLKDAGVVGGGDITMEAAITKLMFLLANDSDPEQVKQGLRKPICGENTPF